MSGHAKLAEPPGASPTRVSVGMAPKALSLPTPGQLQLLLLSYRRNLVLTAKHVLVQVLIAKLALGVVLPADLNKVRHLLVKTF